MTERLDQVKLGWWGPTANAIDIPLGSVASFAAAKWQQHALAAIAEFHHAEHCEYAPFRSAPIGPVLAQAYAAAAIRYINWAGVREVDLAFGAFRYLRRRLPANAVLVTYNLNANARLLGRLWRMRGGRWIPIVADVPDVSALKSVEQASWGVCYLSWHAYENARAPRRFFMPGGVYYQPHKKKQHSLTPIAVYSGNLSVYGGFETILKAIDMLPPQSVELHVVASGRTRDEWRGGNRVRYLGSIDESKLAEVYSAASLLLNPRPTSLEENKWNFPSKLLDYLSFDIPVLSTGTAGLSPSIARTVTLVDDSPAGFAQKIRDVLAGNDDRLSLEHRQRWRISDGSWRSQAQAFSKWISS